MPCKQKVVVVPQLPMGGGRVRLCGLFHSKLPYFLRRPETVLLFNVRRTFVAGCNLLLCWSVCWPVGWPAGLQTDLHDRSSYRRCRLDIPGSKIQNTFDIFFFCGYPPDGTLVLLLGDKHWVGRTGEIVEDENWLIYAGMQYSLKDKY